MHTQLQHLGVGINLGMEQALFKALAVKAENRYQVVEDFQAALLKVEPGSRLKEVSSGVAARKPVERLDVEVDEEEQAAERPALSRKEVTKKDGFAFTVGRQMLKYVVVLALGAL